MSMRLFACAAAAAVVCVQTARADDFGQNIGIDMGGMGMGIKIDVNDHTRRGNAQVKVQASSKEEISSSTPGEAFHLVYEDDPSGACSFRVLEPERHRLKVTDGGFAPVHQDSIPTSFRCQPGKFYRFEVMAGPNVVFDKKFEAKRGKVATLRVATTAPVNVQVAVHAPPPHHDRRHDRRPPPPPARRERGPSCMADSDLSAISGEISNASFSSEQLQVLEEAMKHRTICGEQVVRIIGLFSFSSDQLQALRYMAPKIADPQNNFKIYGAFTFDSDKKKAKEILQ